MIRKLIPGPSLFRLILLFFLLHAVPAFTAGIDLSNPEISLWYSLIDADITAVEDLLGDSYIDIEPSAVKSMANRLLWYEEGISLWICDGRVVQLRLDSALPGSAGGISIGSPASEIIQIFGKPWIESADNLYYNLPWRSGPVRLRLIFVDSGLSEIYLYIVR